MNHHEKNKDTKNKIHKTSNKVEIVKMECGQTFATLTSGQVSQTSSSKKGRYIDYFAYYLYSLYKENLLIQK
jgi:hypothetical protein